MQEWKDKGVTVSCAESCTGGRIASAITAKSGASNYFRGGIVAYQNDVKIELLGVDAALIEEYDVVSQPVVEAMVRGCCRLFRSDVAMASTGYAEPWDNHAVGIWIGWGSATEVHSMFLSSDQGRVKNVEHATEEVIRQLDEFLTVNKNR